MCAPMPAPWEGVTMKRLLRAVGFVGLFAVMAVIAGLQAAVRAMQGEGRGREPWTEFERRNLT